MNESLEKDFLEQIQANEGIIHKVIGLYIEESPEKKDAYQEVLLQAWKSYPKFRKEAKFSTWLYKVSLNTVLTVNKKWKRPTEPFTNQELKLDPPEEKNDTLFRIIKTLNPIDKMIITLHLDGYKNKEIAEISGMNSNHVNVKVHRLKEKIISTFKRINND